MARKPRRPPYKTVGSGGSARPDVTVAAGGSGGGESGATLGGGGGGVVVSAPPRSITSFQIFESDLRTLGQLNRRAVFLFSLSGFFVNVGIGIIFGFAFADPNSPLSELGEFIWKYGSYSAFGVAFIAFLFGIWEWLIKRGNVDRIYEEHGLERKRLWRGVNT